MIKDLQWGYNPGLLGGLNVITTVLVTGRLEGQSQRRSYGGRSKHQSDVIAGRDHKPRNVGSLWKLEKPRYEFSLEPPRKNAVLLTP